MSDDLAAKLREQAEQMLRQAELLEQEAEAEIGDDQGAADTPADVMEQMNRESAEEAAPEPVTGMPEDETKAERDPLEPVDMREELVKVRQLLPSRGFVKKQESAAGEVWEKSGPRGEPGFRATLVADPHGRIRMELRNPSGFIVTQAEPATLIDCEIALSHVP